MTLQQVRYILEISRYSSISKAAQELYLTQPYLSSMLKELENELHITIFNRTRKGVKLTEEGKNFIRIAKNKGSCHFISVFHCSIIHLQLKPFISFLKNAALRNLTFTYVNVVWSRSSATYLSSVVKLE